MPKACFCVLLLLPVTWLLVSRTALAESSGIGSGAAVTLKETLEKGLQARRPAEIAFLATVAQRVENGTLPRSLVESTFLWARGKRPYPFPYFQRGLKVRAKKLGIMI